MIPRRYLASIFAALFLSTISWVYWHKIYNVPHEVPHEVPHNVPAAPSEPEKHPPWQYKPKPEPSEPITENLHLPLPPIPSKPHPDAKTPLFIGMTRNNNMLQQVVVSYLAAGWPKEDIYVVENTGVMMSNRDSRLSLQNPFFLNHTALSALGVNILITPTLLNFAQLQNFYLYTAIQHKWDTYFWSHMDVVVLGADSYQNVVDAWKKQTGNWAALWYAYDKLTLVKTAAYEAVGGWDTFVGYYNTDCDMHERLFMAGYDMPAVDGAIPVWDVAETLPDLHVFFDGTNLRPILDDLQNRKGNSIRNTWQGKQTGGQGEPYYKEINEPLARAMKDGKYIYAKKWGHKWCALREVGLKADDAWKVEKDWEFFYDQNCE